MDSIRYKRISGIDECRKVLLQFRSCLESLQEEGAIDFFARKFSNYAYVIVAENGLDESMGFIAYYANNIESKTAFVTMIATLPSYRGKHIGQSLLEYCKKDILTKGFVSVQLEVRKDNIVAQRFYRNNGFVVVDEKENLLMSWEENRFKDCLSQE